RLPGDGHRIGGPEDGPIAGFARHVLPEDGIGLTEPGEQLVRRTVDVDVGAVDVGNRIRGHWLPPLLLETAGAEQSSAPSARCHAPTFSERAGSSPPTPSRDRSRSARRVAGR